MMFMFCATTDDEDDDDDHDTAKTGSEMNAHRKVYRKKNVGVRVRGVSNWSGVLW